MISKYKLYKIALVSTAMILMLVNIVGAQPANHDDRTGGCGVTLITDPCTQSVDLLEFPTCGCGHDGNWGCGERGRGERESEVTLITDPCTQSVDLLKFPTCGCGDDGTW